MWPECRNHEGLSPLSNKQVDAAVQQGIAGIQDGKKKSKLEFCVQKLQEELREYKEHIPPCWNIWVASSLRRQWDIMKLDK